MPEEPERPLIDPDTKWVLCSETRWQCGEWERIPNPDGAGELMVCPDKQKQCTGDCHCRLFRRGIKDTAYKEAPILTVAGIELGSPYEPDLFKRWQYACFCVKAKK